MVDEQEEPMVEEQEEPSERQMPAPEGDVERDHSNDERTGEDDARY